ncbi:GNAT family protein [Glutamicibacter sp.]|uniref:GNAT family N-acetyltransferase n=1 Tax=Glutamicibacter sp. TaxID=1931995 RepID=UPI0028BE2EAB|nr:GNAT family protein [Glutamicibacter sp.]
MKPIHIQPGIELRLLQRSDAAELAAAYLSNKEHLAQWEPIRPAEYFTKQWQERDLESRLELYQQELAYPLALFEHDSIIGRFTLTGITRGPFQNASLGYWMDADYCGRGLATATVREICAIAGTELGLHRIEASTLLHNIGSQRVLLNSGFQLIGTAPRYLKIAGRWQDHHLYQRILED